MDISVKEGSYTHEEAFVSIVYNKPANVLVLVFRPNINHTVSDVRLTLSNNGMSTLWSCEYDTITHRYDCFRSCRI